MQPIDSSSGNYDVPLEKSDENMLEEPQEAPKMTRQEKKANDEKQHAKIEKRKTMIRLGLIVAAVAVVAIALSVVTFGGVGAVIGVILFTTIFIGGIHILSGNLEPREYVEPPEEDDKATKVENQQIKELAKTPEDEEYEDFCWSIDLMVKDDKRLAKEIKEEGKSNYSYFRNYMKQLKDLDEEKKAKILAEHPGAP